MNEKKRRGEHFRVKSLYFYVKHECVRYFLYCQQLKTKVESGLEKLGRSRVLLETLQKEAKMILTMVVSSAHIGMTCMRLGQRGVEFGQIGILGIPGILMILVM